MSRQTEVYQWMTTIREHLPHLSKPQAVVLALWSFGVVIVGACGQSSIVGFLAQALGQKENTVRQRLREWCWEAAAKQGDQRQSVVASTCFGPLLQWVMAWLSRVGISIIQLRGPQFGLKPSARYRMSCEESG